MKQVAPLSQRDRATGWVSCGQKWKTIVCRQYRSVFNHCDEIGLQSIKFGEIKKNKCYDDDDDDDDDYAVQAFKVVQGHRCRYQSKDCMRLPISD